MMEKTLARRADPQTSHDAARSVLTSLSRQHSVVMRLLAGSVVPLAAEQISDLAGFACWRRMNELQNAGLIKVAEGRHRNRSGRMAQRYQLDAIAIEDDDAQINLSGRSAQERIWNEGKPQ